MLANARATAAPLLEIFATGMRELDWIAGRDYVIDDLYAEGHVERLPALADELALARSFASLMQLRFGPTRVQLQWQTEAVVTRVPALSLQPLLENAFVHAVEPRNGLTTIRIELLCIDGHLRITVADDGDGPREGAAPGVALENLRERLHTLYGSAA